MSIIIVRFSHFVPNFLFSFEIKISSSGEPWGLASVASVFWNPDHTGEIVDSLNKKLKCGTCKSCSGTANFCMCAVLNPPGSRICGLYELKSLPWKQVVESLKSYNIMIGFSIHIFGILHLSNSQCISKNSGYFVKHNVRFILIVNLFTFSIIMKMKNVILEFDVNKWIILLNETNSFSNSIQRHKNWTNICCSRCLFPLNLLSVYCIRFIISIELFNIWSNWL
jgi:hypothetical protein